MYHGSVVVPVPPCQIQHRVRVRIVQHPQGALSIYVADLPAAASGSPYWPKFMPAGGGWYRVHWYRSPLSLEEGEDRRSVRRSRWP